MKRLLAIGLLALASACNTSHVNQTAPPLVGETWVRAGGDSSPAELANRWTLVEFFTPT